MYYFTVFFPPLAPPARRAHRYRRHHHKGRRERRKHKRHGHREGGHHGGEAGQGHNHVHFWTKTSPFFSCAADFSLPDSLLSTFHNLTAQNSLPEPPPPSPPKPTLPPCTARPLSSESACVIVESEAWQSAARFYQDWKTTPFILFLLSFPSFTFLS